MWHCSCHNSLSVCASGWMCQVVFSKVRTCPHAQDGGGRLNMQVPQVAAGHLPERKQSVTMMQVHHSDMRLPDLASVHSSNFCSCTYCMLMR